MKEELEEIPVAERKMTEARPPLRPPPGQPRQPAWKTGQALGITRPVPVGELEISPRTASRLCYSADRTLLHDLEDSVVRFDHDAYSRQARRLVREVLDDGVT